LLAVKRRALVFLSLTAAWRRPDRVRVPTESADPGRDQENLQVKVCASTVSSTMGC